MAKSYYNIIEVLVGIFTVDGTLKVLLKRKQNDPYKGYWILPGNILSNEQTLEQCATRIVESAANYHPLYLYQDKCFSNLDRDPEERIIASSFTALISKELVKASEMEWFDINSLPKMAYDHYEIINNQIIGLKSKILKNEDNILWKLFSSEFTLTELQAFFEYLLNRKLDKRNFRKKMLGEKIVLDTGEKVNTAGRPSKLYVFNKGGD